MDVSPRLSLPYLAPQQAQKHVTVNEALRALDALVQLSVLSAATTAEPASPAEGDAYILPADATGSAWGVMAEGAIAVYRDGAWAAFAPGDGWRAWVIDEETLYVSSGGEWFPIAGAAGEFGRLGVNTAADATNRLAVKSDAVLFSHDDVTPGAGDIRIVLNKEASGDTASFLFQKGFSGRAEFGLIGSDDFTLKVSADGSAWNDVVLVDKATGRPNFQRHVGVKRTPPADFWSSGNDARGLFLPYGYFGTNGSFGHGLWYNGYRGASAWMSQGVNGSNVGAGVELTATGIFFRLEDAPAGLSPAIRFRVDASSADPGNDNAMSSGSASRRWTQVYAASGTINTSDARDKEIAGDLSDAEKRAARRLLAAVRKFRWKDSVSRKGGAARLHFGFTAQEVRDAFAAEGLDAAAYGVWCEDEIVVTVDDPDRGVIDRPTGRTAQGLRYGELFAFLFAAMAS